MSREKKQKRAGLYIRVSTPDQHPELQIPDLENMAAAKRWAVVDRYIDHGVSGRRLHRPELDRMMDDVRAGKIDAIVCWSVSRFGRSMVNTVMLIDELKQRGVVTVFHCQGLDTSTAVGRGVCALLAALAEDELEEMSARTKLGQQAARDKGNFPGRPARDDIDPEFVLELREQGLTWPEIQEEMGIAHSTIRRHVGWYLGTVEKKTPMRAI